MSEPQAHEMVASVAVVGMAGRFPGAANVDAFWQNISQGLESIDSLTAEELREAGVSPDLSGRPNYVNAKGVLDDAVMFDAAFFGINRREAEAMDPQQRVFLECAWEALEAAGHDAGSFQGSIGVFAGTGMNSYLLSNLLGNQALLDSVGSYQMMLGNDKDFLCTRVSYKLNLKGPSVVIQSACSTSLVAIQTAYQSLLNFQCDMALAGGVSIEFPQRVGYLYQQGMIMSPDGHCRAFDAAAEGTVAGEGVGIVVLRRLEDALESGDNILAVIRAAAINNDGAAKIGFTAPSVDGQAEVIAMAQSLAGVSPETIGFVEAHGTGTPLGDPIEVAALTRAFRMKTSKVGFCALGSVKTNIGHLNAAAGVASLIKTILALQHRQIPPSLNFQQPNPEIDLTNSPFYISTTLVDWEATSGPRRAGVSSFGMGGTNAHLVLEEAPRLATQSSRRANHLLLISAKTPGALDSATQRLAAALTRDASLDLADTAYTLQTGRRQFPHRRIVVCCNRAEAAELLSKQDNKRVFTANSGSEKRDVIFLLAGQGSQATGMAREIYETEPVFRQQLDHCLDRLTPALGMNLRDVIYPAQPNIEKAEEQLLETRVAQPAIFAIDYSLAKLWMHWGITPTALLGHSLGEYVAACLAGVFSLDDALDLVVERGRLMQSVATGAMLSVPLAPEDLTIRLGADLSLAAINTPTLCVASGPLDAVARLQKVLSEENVSTTPLRTSHAFHSAMMDGIIDLFVRKLASIPLHAPKLPVMSNLTGTWLTAEQATDPGYWARHLRNPVQFAASIAELLSEPNRVFLEIGAGRTLTSMARQQAQAGTGHLFLSSLPHPQDRAPDSRVLLTTLGRMWASGVRVDWRAFHEAEQRRRVVLPSYPFQRERFYAEPQKSPSGASRGEDRPSKIQDVSRWFYVPSWRRTAVSAALPRDSRAAGSWLLFLDDHGVGEALAERVRSEGADVILVRAGQGFSRADDGNYTIHLAHPAEYDEVFRDLLSRDRLPSRIVHLFTLTANDCQYDFETMLDRAFYSLVYAVQSLIKVDPAHPLRVDVVSNASQDVSGAESVCADKALMHGPCRVMAQEFGNLRCRNIDICTPALNGNPDANLILHLLAELTSDSPDPVIALRGEQRWVQHFEPVILPHNGAKQRFREGGVYLITGGLGTIGLLIARHIARRVRGRFVLVGRTDLQARSEWRSYGGEQLTRRIEAIRAIEALGSEVLTMRADVGDEGEMRAVLQVIEAKFGALHGVVHAAGAVAPEAFAGISELDHTRCRPHFRTKVEGTRVLDRLLRDRPLDFCLLASSLSAVLGGLGFTAYAAANSFMDAFALERNRKGSVPWITVDWDGWLPAEHITPAQDCPIGMSQREGLETFDRIINTRGLRHVVVSVSELSRRSEQWIRRPKSCNEGGALTETRCVPEPDTSDHTAFGSATETAVAGIWKDLLGVNRIGPEDDFFELGGHSLLATQLMARIRTMLGVDVPVRQIFDARTVPSLARALDNALLARTKPADTIASANIPCLTRANRKVRVEDFEVASAQVNKVERR